MEISPYRFYNGRLLIYNININEYKAIFFVNARACMRSYKTKISFALTMLLLFCIDISKAKAVYSLPTDRTVTWQGNAGVLGDIPTRNTIFITLSPSGGDDTASIQNAINSCPFGQVVKLNAGTFKVSSPLVIKSNVTVRGSGMGTTIIQGQAGMSGSYVVGFDYGAWLSSSISISSGLSKGSTSITTSTSHGWSVGDLVLIDQINNSNDDPPVSNVGNNGPCDWCGRESGARSLGQVVKILTVPNSNAVTFEIPLYWNYDASLSPNGTELRGLTLNAGLENITIDNSLSGSNLQNESGTVLMSGTSNCWMLNTEVIGSYQSILRFEDGAYRNTIRGCKFHESMPVSAVDGSSSFAQGRAYGISSYEFSSANLIENNQIYHVSAGVMTSGPFSGNVIAYNYIADLYLSSLSWNPYAISFHGAHAFMNLIEGNIIESRVAGDNVWGTKSHNTLFRNKISSAPGRSGAAWDIDIQSGGRYFNIAGNVLGKGSESLYTIVNANLSSSAIYRFGYEYDSDYDSAGNDAGVYATVLRHSNWDSFNDAIILNDNQDTLLNSDDAVLSDSLYLPSKPAWWGASAWPLIGPDLVPMEGDIPAKAIYWDASTPSAPTGIFVQ